MKVRYFIWAGQHFPDDQKTINWKLKEDKKEYIVYPLPSWFEHEKEVLLSEEELFVKIRELSNLNFYVMVRQFKDYLLLAADHLSFRQR